MFVGPSSSVPSTFSANSQDIGLAVNALTQPASQGPGSFESLLADLLFTGGSFSTDTESGAENPQPIAKPEQADDGRNRADETASADDSRHDQNNSTVVAPTVSAQISSLPNTDVIELAVTADSLFSAISQALDQLGGQAGQSGPVELSMDLNFPLLGRVQLHLLLDENQLRVHLWVQDDETQRRVEEGLEVLRNRLAGVGVELVQCGVDSDGESSPESSTEIAQPENGQGTLARKPWARLTRPRTLVDVIA